MLASLSPPSLAAEALFHRLLLGFSTAERQLLANCFHAKALVEYPYAPQLGMPTLLQGRAAIEEYLLGALRQMPGLVFGPVRFTHDPVQQVHWAEVQGETTVPTTGNRYQQDYLMRFEVRDGMFYRYREYWNQLAVQQAFTGAGEAPLGDTFSAAPRRS